MISRLGPHRSALCSWLATIVASAMAAAPFPAAFDTETSPGGPMPAEQAAAGIQLAPGFLNGEGGAIGPDLTGSIQFPIS